MCVEPRQLPDDISFERWVEHVFDHPAAEQRGDEWWWSEDDEYSEWNEEDNPALTLQYITKLFESPRFLAIRFSRAQIDQGFNYLISPACSNHMFVVRDATLPWDDRRACIRAIAPLFRDLFAKVYGDDAECTRPHKVSYACFMWWDVIPIWAEDGPVVDEVLSVLRQTLRIQSNACVESALHGLGEFHCVAGDRTSVIIQDFLKECRASNRKLPAKLVEYAQAAAVGDIL